MCTESEEQRCLHALLPHLIFEKFGSRDFSLTFVSRVLCEADGFLGIRYTFTQELQYTVFE